MMLLLEPDPDKRPSVRDAMGERWISEGYAKKPLHTLSPKNRLCPEDLNSSVLAYMTETLGYSVSEVIDAVTTNRPSALMASYHLLLNKFNRSHKGTKAGKKLENNDWTPSSKATWKNKSNTESKTQSQSAPKNEKSLKQFNKSLKVQQTSRSQNRRTTDLHRKGHHEDDENCPPSPALPHIPHSASPPLPSRHPSPFLYPDPPSAEDGTSDEEVTISVNTRETLFPEVSVFGERELVHLSPPKGSTSQLCDSAPCHVPIPAEPIRNSIASRPIRHTHLLRTTQLDGAADPGSDCFQEKYHQENSHHLSINERLEKLQMFYASEKNAISPRILLEAGPILSPDRGQLGSSQTTQMSPSHCLPRLHNVGLKDGRGRKVTWAGLSRPGPPRLLVNGSKLPVFPSQRQHPLIMKSLGQERARRKELTVAGSAQAGEGVDGDKRNSVQLLSSPQQRVADLNLPLLPVALQGKTDRKNQLHTMDY
ncbi:hypothetical protein AMECASPLE_016966 [Ameca splendens]|uniref:Uncharacterized protein n=1 Tax=Ameca splendens TaxID=208324 RepID=A0ABV1A0F9_9TELE